MGWDVLYTDEMKAWMATLTNRQQEAAYRAGAPADLEALRKEGEIP